MNIFEQQVSVEQIEGGRWFQPENPVSFEPMTDKDGNPLRLRVRSVASEAYRDYENKRQRKTVGTLVGGRGKRAQNKLVNETSKVDDAERFATLVTALENVEKVGVTTPSYEDLLKFCADQDSQRGWVVRSGMVWLVQAVIDFANDDTNFGAEAGNGAPKSDET
jgi:hypothetical protein